MLAAVLTMVAAAACGDGTGPEGFVVTGRIENNTLAPIPVNTRLLAVWGVSSGTPDYGYVFGEGTINRLAGTFRIRFDQPPPDDALNMGELGVAFLIATTDQSLTQGRLPSGPIGYAGLTARYAVIFLKSENASQFRSWATLFDIGYSVGVGVEALPGETFDTFRPDSPSSPVLIIDVPANIDIVNWT
ncbi:MAG TPA: hypothetical protein VFO67_19980 [Gemmatimonadales bacterium]|nr:hypothetical protein [Gemmatimonadales bacterium]